MPSHFVVEQIPFYAHSLAIAYDKVINTPKEEIDLSPAVLEELLLLGPIFQQDANIPKEDQLSRSQLKKRAAALYHAIYAELEATYSQLHPIEARAKMMQYGIYFIADPNDSPEPGVLASKEAFATTHAFVYGYTLAIKLPQEVDTATRAVTPKKATTIEVFYATDRNRTGDDTPNKMYGGERSESRDPVQGPVEYGICEVSIPPGHKVGEIESPTWWKFEFSPNPEKHVVLLSVEAKPKDLFFEKMQATIQAANRKEAFVFVHGYNVAFEEAAKRCGQIAFDLGFDGAPVMYSWPSKGATAAYTIDEASIQWTKSHLQEFLLDLAARSGAETIHLIAHSMGNRALSRAFADLSKEQEQAVGAVFKNVILTAPDIDADVFKKEIAPAMLKSKSHITLYASSNDRALQLSKKIHGHPRAGDSGKLLVVMPGIDTIDATDANTGLLGHSYFAESADIITDIVQIMQKGERAAMRKGLIKQVLEDLGEYWIVPGSDDMS